MAGLAQIGGGDMRRALASGNRAVVAGATGVRGKTVIKHRHQPIHRGVAGLTNGRGRYVGGTLARGNYAVMTTFTAAIHLRVVHRGHRHPTHRRVTGVALHRGIDVGGILAGGHHAIVATLAGAHGFIVVHRGRGYPGGYRVAGGAHVTGANMGRGFIGGNHPVVTGLAHAHRGDLTVVHRACRNPRGINMACLTQIRSTDVCR